MASCELAPGICSMGAAKWIGYQLPLPVICCPYRPDQSILQQCRQAGADLAEKARRLAGK